MIDDNNSIDEYVNTLRTMIKENSEDEKFTNDMRNLFNDVKDVKQYITIKLNFYIFSIFQMECFHFHQNHYYHLDYILLHLSHH